MSQPYTTLHDHIATAASKCNAAIDASLMMCDSPDEMVVVAAGTAHMVIYHALLTTAVMTNTVLTEEQIDGFFAGLRERLRDKQIGNPADRRARFRCVG